MPDKPVHINPIIIFGSSRSKGNTWNAIQQVIGDRKVPIIDLNEVDITPFDYEGKNADDDFVKIVEKMVGSDPIILATPIYWYSMSAIMKTFMDRWTDLLTRRKELGRKLRGKTLYLIASYSTSKGEGEFEKVFEMTAKYMGMKYGGCFTSYVGPDEKLKSMNEQDARNLTQKIF